MPPILDHMVKDLTGKGMPKAKAFGIAVGTLQKAGDLKPGTNQATPQGIKRGLMTPAQQRANPIKGKGKK